MANTVLNVTRTDANTNETLNQTLTDLNPAATNAQLKAFAQAFYGLSDDTYVDATRVDKTDVDTEGGGTGGTGGKQFRNITVTGLTPGGTATVTFNSTSDETYTPIVFFWTSSGTTYLSATAETRDDPAVAKYTFTAPNSSGTVYVGATEKENFYSEIVRVVCE